MENINIVYTSSGNMRGNKNIKNIRILKMKITMP